MLTIRNLSAIVALLATFILVGCSGSSTSGSGADSDAGSQAAPPGEATALTEKSSRAEGANGADKDSSLTPAQAGRDIIRTGNISIAADNLAKARDSAARITRDQGGMIASEDSVNEDDYQSVDLTLRVPSEKFDATMEDLATIGDVTATGIDTEDVTSEVVDVEARIKVQTASVQRVARLMDRAKSISDIVSLEQELARRQADLESLKQRQQALKDQTSLATIRVSIHAPGEEGTDDDESGFLAGLESGWEALKDSTTALFTVVGALLPFALLGAAIGYPLWRWLRRRVRTGSNTPAQNRPAAPADQDH